MQEINFAANLDWAANTLMLFIFQKIKETIFISHKEVWGTMNVFHKFILL